MDLVTRLRPPNSQDGNGSKEFLEKSGELNILSLMENQSLSQLEPHGRLPLAESLRLTPGPQAAASAALL